MSAGRSRRSISVASLGSEPKEFESGAKCAKVINGFRIVVLVCVALRKVALELILGLLLSSLAEAKET